MGQGVVGKLVDGVLVQVALAIVRVDGRQPHETVAKEGDLLTVGTGAIGHLVGGYFAKSEAFGLSLVGIVATGGQGCGGQGTCAKGFEKLSSIHEVICFCDWGAEKR